MSAEKYSRQNHIVPTDLLDKHVLIIGVGAVGKEVSRTLAANGIKNITIYDFDTIEEANCVTQGYYQKDVGRPKVEAASEEMININPDVKVNAINDRWRPKKKESYDAVFICVDTFDMRRRIFNYYNEKVPFLFDSRIGGEQIRLLSVFDKSSREWYEKTIGDDKNSYQVGCHVPMIKHSANIAAANMVQQFFSAIQDRQLFADRTFAMPSGEFYDNESP